MNASQWERSEVKYDINPWNHINKSKVQMINSPQSWACQKIRA